ncbi:FAD-binding oxidoreductase [Tomitella cavernea]|nr:FAD-binding oxidoreductase [Tomitella cavernea]
MPDQAAPARSAAGDPALTDALQRIVGPAHVITDPAMLEGYVADRTGRWRGTTAAVVRPADTAEVSAVLACCHDAGAAVVPQGGNTGLVGGSVPLHGEVVVSTSRLTAIDNVDPVGRTLSAGAGVTVAAAEEKARRHGLTLGIDLASRDSATLGGIVSTNAGGLRMIRYGDTRSRLLGVEAVLADGRVLTRWKALTKDNVGYDLPGLLAGAEGTLGVVTRVLMKLSEPAGETAVALAGIPDVGEGLALVRALEHAGLIIEAAELMTRDGMRLVGDHLRLRAPLDVDAPYAVLVEVSGPAVQQDALLSVLAGRADAVLDAAVEHGPARRLWQYREAHTESVGVASSTPPVKLDVSTPLSRIEAFLGELGPGLSEHFPGVRPVCFGHFADGNIHVNLMDVEPAQQEAITDHVLRLVARHGGSISAEHGVGRAKLPWIALGREPVDLAVMDAVRGALDPARMLNPGLFHWAAAAHRGGDGAVLGRMLPG